MIAEANPATPERQWRWVIIALLFFGTVVNYLDRLAIPVLSPVLQADFHLTNVQYAWISSSFLITYALATFV
jgi:ACS family hexuronate transporter-like MFS transporter